MKSKTKRRSNTTVRRILGVLLSLVMVLTAVFSGIGPNLLGSGLDEVYAKEIGSKNEDQQQGCVGVVGGQPPAGYTNEFQKTDPNAKSVFRGGTSFSALGSKNSPLDDDVNDFARPLPYGDTYVDTNKLNWDNPNNFIIDIKDERFVWVSSKREVLVDANGDPILNASGNTQYTGVLLDVPREDKLGHKSTANPFDDPDDPSDDDLIIAATNGGAETFIAYMGPLESYLPNITDKESSDGTKNVIKAPEGSYLYRITYLDAVTLPNGTRGNLVITMKQVLIESSFEVNKNNPNIGYDEDGNELYRYENALIQIQGPNQMGVDIDQKDSNGQWVNKYEAVVKTAAEVEAYYRLTNEKLTSGKYTEKQIADNSKEQKLRHAAGAILDFDLEVVDSEGNPVAGTISYAAHDLDFDTKQNIWGRSVDDDNKYMFAEGLKIVEGSKSYALVPEYNEDGLANNNSMVTGWVPVRPSDAGDGKGYLLTNEKETAPLNVEPGNGNNADGVRFSSKGITKVRDANGKFDDVPFYGGQIAIDKGYAYTAGEAPIQNNDITDTSSPSGTPKGNGLRNNAYRKIFYGKLVEGGYKGTVNGITLKDMHDYWLGDGSWEIVRTDPDESFDTGFAVLLDATKSSLQWSGSRQSGAGINTTLFDSSIYTYVEPTHGTGGGIYIESYDINNECATKMVEGSTVMGRNSEVTITAVPEGGYRVGRILIGDTNYSTKKDKNRLDTYRTYTIDGNDIYVDGVKKGTFNGADITGLDGHEGLKAGIVELDGFSFNRDEALEPTDASQKIIIERNADGTVDVTLPKVDNPMHVHVDFAADYYFYKVWKDGSKPEELTMTAAPAGVYPTAVEIPMPTGEYNYIDDGEGNSVAVAITEMTQFEINGAKYTAINGVNAGVEFVLSPNNTVEYVEYETNPDTGEPEEKFAIRSNVVLAGNEFVHYTYTDEGDYVVDARYPLTIETSVADWESDDTQEFDINASKYDARYEGYVTELDESNEISPGNKVWVVKYPSTGVAELGWPELPVEILPKDDGGNVIDNHEAANHTDRYYWFVTEEVPAWSTEGYSNKKAKDPGVINNPEGKDGYYDDALWVAASLKDVDMAKALIHDDENKDSYAYMSVFKNGGEITNETTIVVRGKKEWQDDFDNKYKTRKEIWLHLDVKITNPETGATIVRKDVLPPQKIDATATGSALTKQWGTKASYKTGDSTIKVVASANKVPGNAKLQKVDGTKVYTGPYKLTRKGTTTYYYINQLKEKDADGNIYEYSIRETLDYEGEEPVEKDDIDKGLLGYTSEDVADWEELKAHEDTYRYKYTYNGENRTIEMKRFTGTVENKYELIDFTITKKWVDNKDDAEHTADEIKNAITLFDKDGEVDLDALGQYTTKVKTDAGEIEEQLGLLEVTPDVGTSETNKEFTLTWKHLPKYIGDGEGNIAYAGYYATETKFDGYADPMYTNVNEPGTPKVDESEITDKAFNNGLIVNSHLININVEKLWDDADNQDGKRADIAVTLFRNGAEYEKVQLKESDATKSKTNVDGDTWTWEGVWEDLPYADANGNPYNYTAQETEKPEGYESQQAVEQITLTEWNDEKDTLTFKATNKHDPEKISFTVTKIWDDANDNDGMRPDNGEVTYTLKAKVGEAEATALSKLPEGAKITQGEEDITKDFASGTITVKTEDEVTITVENLDKYAKAGQEITYTLEEAEIDEYDTEVTGSQTAGFTVTNTHDPEKASIKVTKVWDDKDNQDGKRKETKVVLYQTVEGGNKTTAKVEDAVVTIEGGTATVASAGEGATDEYTWTNLPVYENGKRITYSVEEAAVDGYTTTYDPAGVELTKDEISELTVTNTYEPETIALTITKVWDDANNQDGARPENGEVTYTIKANGTALTADELAAATVTGGTVDGATIKAKTTGTDGDTVTVADLPKNEAVAQPIEYTVEEAGIENYTTKITGDAIKGFTVTNTYEPEKIEIFVKKVWNDANNQDGKRLKSVIFQLVAGDEEKGTITLNESNSWQGSFKNLDKYKDGEEIAYTVKELMEEALHNQGYTIGDTTGTGTSKDPLIITNTHEPEQVTITATKVWNDMDNKYGIRKDVTFRLFADGTEVSAKTISKDATGDDLTVEWTVDKYRNGGTEIAYTIVEDNVSPYSQEITGDAENGFIVTNTYPPVIEEITVTRTIIYTYLTEDGQEASGTVTQTVTLQRVPTVLDEAGGVVEWSAWEVIDGDTSAVDSPEIKGWTADRDVPEWEIEYDEEGMPKNATEHVIYTPEPPVGTPDETWGGKGESQTGTPTFEVTTPTTPDGSENKIVKIELLDEDGNPTDTVEVPEGTYKLKDDGTITFTPNDPEYVGDPTPVNVRGTDKNGLTADTTYTPHVVDNTETEEVTRTIEYEYADGTKVVDKDGNPIVKEETLKFTRTGTVDPKTGKVTYKDEDWKPETTDKFDKVTSPTEDNPGDATNLEDWTPDIDVDEKTVKATDDDIHEKVIYNPKALEATPDETWGLKGEEQTGTPTFTPETETLPDGTPNTVDDIKLINPSTGEPIDEPVYIDGQGTYTLNEDGTITFTPDPDYVGNPTPIGVIGTDKLGNVAKTTYTPHVVDPTEEGEATRTIHYTYETKDGEEVTEDTVQTVKLTRIAKTVDPKTGEVTEWNDWTPEKFESVENPDDKATKDGKEWTTEDVVEEFEVTEPGDYGVVNVVYQAVPVPPVLDPPTGSDKETYGLKGEEQSDTPEFTKGTGEIPEEGAYSLEEPDENNPLTKTIPGEGKYTLDPDTGKVTFTPEPDFVGDGTGVTVKVTDENGLTATGKYTPHVVDPTDEGEAKRTIHYTYLTKEGEEVTEDTVQTVKLVRTAKSVDPKTGEVKEWNDWTAEDGSEPKFPAVENPDDKATKDGKTWKTTDKVEELAITEPGDKGTEYVVYQAEEEPVTPPTIEPPTAPEEDTYGGKGDPQNSTPEFKFEEGSGKIPEKGAYTLEDPDEDNPLKKTIPGEGVYELDPDTGKVTFTPEPDFVGDGTGVEVTVTDENGLTATGKYTPHVVDNEQTSTAKRTITYFYDNGDPVLDDDGNPLTKVEEKTFTRKGTVDPKTGKITDPGTWNEENFGDVDSPDIDGYKPDRSMVPGEPANPGDNIRERVIYLQDPPHEETEEKTITRIIRYRYLTKDGEEAFADVVQKVKFTRVIWVDDDGEVVRTEDWIPEKDTMEEVVSPLPDNYTVDRESVDELTINPDDYEDGDVIEEWVIYTPKTIWVTYIDPDGTTIYLEKTTEPKAAKGQKQEEPDAPEDPIKEGYTFDGWDRSEDEEGNITYIAKWKPEPVVETEEKTVTRTIRYWIEKVNGEKAFEEVEQKVTFKRTKTTDADGNVTYGEWDKESDKFTSVTSPDKTDYTVDTAVVPEEEVTPDSKDTVVDVIYTPQQTPPAKTIWVRYIDPDGVTIYLPKTGFEGNEPPGPANPTKDGYTFEGWDRSEDEEGNITYVAKWKPVEVTPEPEKEDPKPAPQPTPKPQPTPAPAPSKSESKPTTGDNSNMMLWIMLAASASLLAGAVTLRRRVR